MELLDEGTHRVLAYVDALNRHGVRPQRQMVEEFAAHRERKFSSSGGFEEVIRSLGRFGGRRTAEETFCQYLARLSWIDETPTDAVELSAVGRALLKSLNAPVIEESTADVFEVVLSPDNPFAYVQALSGLASVKQALLIEPYFRLEQLMAIAEFDNIVRVMVGSRLKSSDYELLAVGLQALPVGRTIEIRKAPDLHDRYLIPAEDGHVVMLGASLGGIGKNVSTLTTLASVASIALRDAHEKIWRAAEPIEPKSPAVPPAAGAPSEVPDKKARVEKSPAKKTPTKKTTS